jgi:hypothetical protein
LEVPLKIHVLPPSLTLPSISAAPRDIRILGMPETSGPSARRARGRRIQRRSSTRISAKIDPLAEELGEAFVRTATSGGDEGDVDQIVEEETGGPFVETTGEDEFAYGTDASNPEDAAREPFPVT